MELWQLRQMQSLPLDAKIEKSKLRIREWFEAWDGQVYVSTSGGKDSTVLMHLVRSMYPRVPGAFADTGLEFPEIREHVKTIENVVWVKPNINFRQVIEKYGYPVISKRQAEYISRVQKKPNDQDTINKCLYGIQKNGKISKFKVSEKWHYLVNAPFKISQECCAIMKKQPLKKLEKMGLKPFIGTLADESEDRQQKYLQTGCNAFDNKRPISRPLGFWTEKDIWDYIRCFNIPYSKIYNMGYLRTG